MKYQMKAALPPEIKNGFSCRGCPDRRIIRDGDKVTTCHAVCEKHRIEKDSYNKARANFKKYRRTERMYDSYVISAVHKVKGTKPLEN